MPMYFPDMPSLNRAAQVWKFREPRPNESESDYRNALADWVQKKDVVESCEIRNKAGWNEFTDEQNLDMVRRQFLSASK